jgi:hypothetical protein
MKPITTGEKAECITTSTTSTKFEKKKSTTSTNTSSLLLGSITTQKVRKTNPQIHIIVPEKSHILETEHYLGQL